MKIKHIDHRSILYTSISAGDLCPSGKLTLKKLMNYFQSLALSHYTHYAQPWDEVIKGKKAWVLNKIEIELVRMPTLSDELEIETWSRGADGFKGLREFSIKSNSEIIIKAQTSWVYLDMLKKKPTFFQREIYPNFKAIAESNFMDDSFSWRLGGSDEFKNSFSYQLRRTDFDINKHLNNTAYFELVDDLLFRSDIDKFKQIRAIYRREVPLGVESLITNTSITEDGQSCFSFFIGESCSFICSIR